VERQTDRLGNLVIADLPRRSGTRLVVKPVDAMLGKAPTPLADGVLVGVERLSDRLVRYPVRRREHDPRPPRQSLCRSTAAGQTYELSPLRSRQGNQNRNLPHGPCPPNRTSMIT